MFNCFIMQKVLIAYAFLKLKLRQCVLRMHETEREDYVGKVF